MELPHGYIPVYLDSLLSKLKECVKLKAKTASNIRRCLSPKFEPPSPLPSTLSNLQHHVTYRVDWKILFSSSFCTIGYPKSAETHFFFMHNALPCKANLKHWYNNHRAYLNDSCTLCTGNLSETAVHVFVCEKWIPVWQFVVKVLKPHFKVKSLRRLLLPSDKSFRNPTVNLIVFSVMHNIWLARNRIVIGKKIINYDWVIFRVRRELRSALEHKFLALKSNSSKESFAETFKALVRFRNQNTLEYIF